MGWIRTVLREVLGLFVDDFGFALAIVLWVAAVWLAAPHLPIGASAKGAIFFAGLALILVESTLRYARTRRAAGRH